MTAQTNQIVAPVSKGRKDSVVLYMAICFGLAVWCIYDGFINKDFIAAHLDQQGRADGTLILNRLGGPILLLAALGLSLWLSKMRRGGLVATDQALIVKKTLQIPYSSIKQIDKTHFQDRGYFLLTYDSQQEGQRTIRLDQRDYDNLGPILERLIEAVSCPFFVGYGPHRPGSGRSVARARATLHDC
ncbi:MAG: hypothetical protein QHH07_00690 [Sedimentisphaerales bacterium]|nr:hypothetical protein [Sedimentisphaerales bacterium]